MKRRYYNADTLRTELDEFEAKYGLSSAEHFRMRYGWRPKSRPESLTNFDSHVWADIYIEWRQLSNAR